MGDEVTENHKLSRRVKRLQNQRPLAIGHSLTYKSSVSSACEASGLQAYPLMLYPHERAWRYFCANGTFEQWFDKCLPGIVLADQWGASDPKDQATLEIEDFCNGRNLRNHDDLRRLDPLGQGVWELKTPDLRLLGWFPDKDYFVAHIGVEKEKLIPRSRYTPFINDVVAYRASISATLPKFVEGGYPDVISQRA